MLIEETARRRTIESQFVLLLEEAGFAEVVLPIIDFAEPYAEVLERDSARRSYRFTDRDGELVAIRSDFTPMVARAQQKGETVSRLPSPAASRPRTVTGRRRRSCRGRRAGA